MSSGEPQVRAVMSEAFPSPGRSPRWRRVAVAGAAAAIVPLVFLGGFAAFVASLERSEREPSQRADAIVALTGGAQRIEDAVDLLDKGYAGRLLITGVNRRTSREAIQRMSPGQRRLFDCCVDLDYAALNTVGNAEMTERWARAQGFDDLILVTSDYHMPRTLLEFERFSPAPVIKPYAVVRPDLWTDDGSMPSGRGLKVLLVEYAKLLATRLRAATGMEGPTALDQAAHAAPRAS